MEKLKHTKGPFTVRLTSIIGHSVIQWDFSGDSNTPRRSIQVETDLAELWANAPSTPHLCDDPQCPGDINRRKLQAAEEMAKAAKLTFDSFGNKSLRIKGYEALQAVLTLWEKAGKGEG